MLAWSRGLASKLKFYHVQSQHHTCMFVTHCVVLLIVVLAAIPPQDLLFLVWPSHDRRRATIRKSCCHHLARGASCFNTRGARLPTPQTVFRRRPKDTRPWRPGSDIVAQLCRPNRLPRPSRPNQPLGYSFGGSPCISLKSRANIFEESAAVEDGSTRPVSLHLQLEGEDLQQLWQQVL